MDIASLQAAYQAGALTPVEVVEQAYDALEAEGARPVWITLVPREASLARARALQAAAARPPLYGIPFAVKDNFDVSGMPTTAACPEFAQIATETATAVQRLLDAGAILVGKTNMDQFATGLVGTRTPYGICSSVFNDEYISGGSSSGSAVAVAKGLVSFALGTDTAGSGRVPAAFNQLVGMKPTRGWVSTHGLLPACRTLDCVSVFTETCSDASLVLQVMRGPDALDAFSRAPTPGEGAAPWASAAPRVGVPADQSLEFFGDHDARDRFNAAVEAVSALGGQVVRFDYEPFRKAASLLYSGPWVAERLAAIMDFQAAHPDAMEPTVGGIIAGASRFSAVETFEAIYALQALRRETEAVWAQADLLLLPTAGTHYTIEEVLQEPVKLNSNLGYYTNFVNLLDLAAVAVPAGFKANGLPFGVTLVGRAFTDDGLLAVADRLHRSLAITLGGGERKLANVPALASTPAPRGCILMAVVGAHLSGQPLNWQLTERKARLVAATRTSTEYRLYALANTTPPKPGLVHEPGFQGAGIEVEVWAMPEDTVGSFLQMIPPPLGLGTLRLADGSMVKGFVCEPAGIAGAKEITHMGGWRSYLKSLS